MNCLFIAKEIASVNTAYLSSSILPLKIVFHFAIFIVNVLDNWSDFAAVIAVIELVDFIYFV